MELLKRLSTAFQKVQQESRQQAKEAQDVAERAAIATAFNDRYTYRKPWAPLGRLEKGTAMYGIMPSAGHAWMCPSCNRIHHPEASSVFSGLQYPRCCKHPAGHRLDDEIRTR